MHDPALFALTVLTLLGTPGPTNTLLATAGAGSGWRGAPALILAENIAYLAAISLIGLVLGPVVAAMPVIGIALRIAVGLYLALTAWRLWRRGPAAMERGGAPIGPWHVFVTTLVNPKAIVFAVAVVPFGAADVGLYLAGFSALAAMVAVAWIGVGTLLGRAATARGETRLVPRVGAAGIGAFAVTVVLSPLFS